MKSLFAVLAALALPAFAQSATAGARLDPLPSWKDGPTKQRIIDFVTAVTKQGGPDFVAPYDRIATFDNDGTLLAEQPMAQAAFLLDRVKALAPQHPEWQTKQPFAAALAGDLDAVVASGEKGLSELFLATHTGMTTADFERIVRSWLITARHPRFDKPYTDLVYQPMIELLSYLRDNGFKTYLVSGGTADFMRPWVMKAYGVPPEQVIGTTFVTRFQVQRGQPELMIEPRVERIDNGPGKPVGIAKFIGRRPILAVGNSDADLQMLQWAASAPGATLAVIVHHTDGDREWAYDRQAKLARLDHALDEANARGWLVIDMKRDWRLVFPFDRLDRAVR
jgi:phosphoserine phosphatase